MVSLAHALNLRVVGERIETSEQSNGLKALGCGMGKGHYFSRPLTSEAMDELCWRRPRAG